MSSTCLELRPLAIQPNDLLRSLGAFEELFSLFDQCFPTNGALAAQIIGYTTVQQWRDALDAVQQRHRCSPLVSTQRLTVSPLSPRYRPAHSAPRGTSPGAQWQREIAEEVNAPFAPDQAPLFRAVLLPQETHYIFILSSHQAVCDGSSRIFLLRDMLLALSAHALEALPLAPSREILFGAQQRTSTEPGLPSFAAQRPLMPHVEGIKLAPEQTTALQRRAREEGVTIHTHQHFHRFRIVGIHFHCIHKLAARRHFYDALENDQARMGGVLAMIAHLYEVEKLARRNGLRGELLRVAREQDAHPMLDGLHAYLLAIREQVLPKSEAGQAIAYTLKNWKALTRYTEDGNLEIDNNGTERTIRGVAKGSSLCTSFSNV